MRLGYIRAIAYGAVVLATAVALTYIPALPDSRPAEIMFSQAAAPSWKLKYDTLEQNGSLFELLKRGGVGDSAIAAIRASSAPIDYRKIPAGMPVEIRTAAADSEPSEVILQLNGDKLVRLKRDGTAWTGAEEKVAWVTDTIVVAGTIQTNLTAAVNAAAESLLPKYAREDLTNEMAQRVYLSKIDMTRELQKGDEFKVMAERSTSPSGAVRIGNVVATTFKLSGSTIKAVHFASVTGGDYFDDQGKSMKTAFMKYPVDFRRISSTFGSRKHPILGYTRAHKGTDFAADEGTSVKAIGDGVVIGAGWNAGYGNLIQIRHSNGFVTRYGHLSKIVQGIAPGTRVKMEQVIGKVGHTGLATGPHLHFEVLVGGQQVNSLKAFGKGSGTPIAKTETAAFQALRDQLLSELEGVSRNTATTLQALSHK